MRAALIVLAVLVTACGSSSPSGMHSPAASQTSPAIPALVGRWERATTCQELVGELDKAGLGALAPYAWLGQTSSSGQSSFEPGSPTPTLSQPCTGAIARVHSHFFNHSGRFGSLDWMQGQVDDSPYKIIDDHTLVIGDTPAVTFHYLIVNNDTLMLSPVITSDMIGQALADP